MEIEVSTIYRVRHPRQLFDLKEMAPNITKVCLDVNLNRDRYAILQQQQYCKELGIDLELIGNEFCINNCIVRDQCYHAHVINKVVEDTLLHEGYPMGYCISHREKNPKEWLYANFILPQHMKEYQRIFGIDHFKITGRTGLTAYLTWVTEQYMGQDFKGNLLELWQDVKNIKRLAKGGQDYLAPRYKINSEKLDINFLEFYLAHQLPISWKDEQEHIEKYLKIALEN
jgi:collagenase-like PrtC family protease